MREHAHELIDQLDPGRLAAVVHLLEAFLDEDSDALSSAEAKAVAEADEWLRHNYPIPHEEVLAEFGLSQADWETMSREPISLKNALKSHLEKVQLHPIKWEILPDRRLGSWEDPISNSRREVDSLLDSIPSLRAYPNESFEPSPRSSIGAFQRGR